MVKAVAVMTVSDTCYKDQSKDTSGPALAEFLQNTFPEANLHTIIVPDEKELIEKELKYFCDEARVDLVFTTGGTGLTSRDVTPEATKAVIQKEIPSISVALTMESLKKTPMAMLSRSVAGVRASTLIINFPGSKKAVSELSEAIKPVLSHAISLIRNEENEIQSVHEAMKCSNQSENGNDTSNKSLSPQTVTSSGGLMGAVNTRCDQPHVTSSVDISKVAFRTRTSPYPMIEMSEAFHLVDSIMQRWTKHTEILPIEQALGRVVAQKVCSEEPMPPFPASAKDGYACLSKDGKGVRVVRAAVTAGEDPSTPLSPGQCARINTGAPLPEGADCVVQVEDTRLVSSTKDGLTELEIEVLVASQPNQDVRSIGFDIPVGAKLVDKGDVIDAGVIGILAGAGYQNVTVQAVPKVGLLSTGNELQEPTDVHLKPAHIRDSNRIMLKVLLREQGYETVDFGIAKDEPNLLLAAITAALRQVDVLVCTGGVSMGERDLLKPVLTQDLNATIHFGRVRMKPGKPTTFATLEFGGRTKFIFGLPGNPVSAYVCCQLVVGRALRQCAGAPSAQPRLRARLARDARLDPRPEYARAILRSAVDGDDLPVATLLGSQCSSRLLSACGAAVLLELPAATDELKLLKAGTVVDALVIGRLDAISW